MEIEYYPKDFQEFIGRFKTDNDCWEYDHWQDDVLKGVELKTD